jgi:pyridoxal phosphate enzyme (YggS family)
LIGHLQRNKAKDAVALFDVIHSVDSLELVQELERWTVKQDAGRRTQDTRGGRAKPLEVLIPVNVSGEATKFGSPPTLEALGRLIQAVGESSHLKLMGLMTIGPFVDDPEKTRPYFRQLRELRDTLRQSGILQPAACSLSMGMSADFEVAIEEGADMVRIGTAIFGERTEHNAEFGMRSSEGL